MNSTLARAGGSSHELSLQVTEVVLEGDVR